MAQPSRLVEYERKKAIKTAFVYVLLTAAFLFVMSRFGPTFLASVSDVISQGQPVEEDSALVPPPQLNLLSEITNQKVVAVSGRSVAGGTVRITFNGEKRDTIANSQGVFTSDIELHEDKNSIRVRAVDARGNTSREIASEITLDTSLPALTIISPEQNVSKNGKKEQQLVVSGTTEPSASVHINDRIAIVNGSGDFSLTFSLNEGENTFEITTTDRAGNQTKETRTVTYTP